MNVTTPALLPGVKFTGSASEILIIVGVTLIILFLLNKKMKKSTCTSKLGNFNIDFNSRTSSNKSLVTKNEGSSSEEIKV